MPDTLQEITANGQALEQLTLRKQELEAQIDDLSNQIEVISGTILPQLMADAGAKMVVLESGRKISYITLYKGKITDEMKPTAFAWLEENKNDGIIKNKLEVTFDRDQNEAAKELARAAMDQGIGQVKIEQNVHPKTLESFIKDQVESGVDISVLREKLGAQIINRVTIK